METMLHEIEIRRAKRALSEQTIPPETIARIMTAATYAPSCANKQPWRFVVLTEPAVLEQAKTALSEGNYWAKKAPCLVLALTKPELDARLNDQRDYALFDVGLAIENLLLQAVHEGLIAHPIAGFDPLKLKAILNIPADYILITVVVLGLPGDESGLSEKHKESEHSARARKPEAEVIRYNAWTT